LKELSLSNLASVDWMILLLYLFFATGIGFSLKSNTNSTKNFFQAGRALPAWLCGLAFLAAGFGSEEVIAMGAAGAKYGLAGAEFYSIGAIPSMLFVALYLMPIYYGSKARSVPEYLALRFDEKTRLLNAALFAAMTLFAAGVSLYAMARVFNALQIFAVPLRGLGLPPQAVVMVTLAFPALVVLAYIFFGGLTGAMYNMVLQFFVLVAGFFPMVILGLRKIGGLSGLKAALPATSYLREFGGAGSGGIAAIFAALGLGIVFGAGFWCADFRVLQTAFAAKDSQSATRTPLIAAFGRLFAPLLLVLTGLIAIGMPTPHTTTTVREDNGAIYHEITVVPPAAEAGQGLVPAEADAAGQPVRDAAGHTVLNYGQAMPNLLPQFLPVGVLGLGVAALLACLMCAVATNIMAFSTVFTCDLYQSRIRKGASDKHYLAAGRWAAAAGIGLAIGIACAAMRFNDLLVAMTLVFATVNAPLFALVLLGIFWKRSTGHGAFAGLLAGASAAIAHHALTLPIAAQHGLHGGWIAVFHRYPSSLAQGLWTIFLAFSASLLVAAAVSLCTDARQETDLRGLVYSLTPKPSYSRLWWQRPEALALLILLLAAALSIALA